MYKELIEEAKKEILVGTLVRILARVLVEVGEMK
jgi:hypothetical protein